MIPKSVHLNYMTELLKTIAIRFRTGESMQDIAQSLGITQKLVEDWIRLELRVCDRERRITQLARQIRNERTS